MSTTQNLPRINTQPQSTSTSISIQTVENSIENLIKHCNKRKRWHHLFHSTKQQEQEQQQTQSPWRIHLANFLESTPIRLIAISLLLIDLIFTVLELVSSFLSCKSSRSKEVDTWLHWLGIGILSLLSLRSLALVVALGVDFFRRPGYVVDEVVLVVALLLEGFLEKMGGGLLVVVSLWRVVTVVESAFELSDEAIELQIEVVLCEFQVLKDENTRLLGVVDEKNEMIKKLQDEIDKKKKGTLF